MGFYSISAGDDIKVGNRYTDTKNRNQKTSLEEVPKAMSTQAKPLKDRMKRSNERSKTDKSYYLCRSVEKGTKEVNKTVSFQAHIIRRTVVSFP